jgi:hypothetical protein
VTFNNLISIQIPNFAEEYGKMKEDIPPMLENAHTKNVAAHSKEKDGEMDYDIGLKVKQYPCLKL